MTTKSMVKRDWAEDMEKFLYYLDHDSRRLEKMKLEIMNSVPSSLTKFARIYIYIYIYIERERGGDTL